MTFTEKIVQEGHHIRGDVYELNGLYFKVLSKFGKIPKYHPVIRIKKDSLGYGRQKQMLDDGLEIVLDIDTLEIYEVIEPEVEVEEVQLSLFDDVALA